MTPIIMVVRTLHSYRNSRRPLDRPTVTGLKTKSPDVPSYPGMQTYAGGEKTNQERCAHTRLSLLTSGDPPQLHHVILFWISEFPAWTFFDASNYMIAYLRRGERMDEPTRSSIIWGEM